MDLKILKALPSTVVVKEMDQLNFLGWEKVLQTSGKERDDGCCFVCDGL